MTRPRVLLVDDNKSFTDLVERWLSQSHELRVIHDPAGALAAIVAEPPDVLLLDLMMPGISGVEILRDLRARPDTAGLPVIVLTAYTILSESEGLAALAPRVVLQKPFPAQALIDCIASILDAPPPGAPDARGKRELAQELIEELQGQGLELVEALDERFPRPPRVHGSRADVIAYDRERSMLHLGIVETPRTLREPGARLRIRELSSQLMGEGPAEGLVLPLSILVPAGEGDAARRLVADMGLGERLLRDIFVIEAA